MVGHGAGCGPRDFAGQQEARLCLWQRGSLSCGRGRGRALLWPHTLGAPGDPPGQPITNGCCQSGPSCCLRRRGLGGQCRKRQGQPRERAVARGGLPAGRGTRCSSHSGSSVGDRTREVAQRPIPPCRRCLLKSTFSWTQCAPVLGIHDKGVPKHAGNRQDVRTCLHACCTPVTRMLP